MIGDNENPWRRRIRETWGRAREGFFDIGRLLLEAKAALPHGEFGKMIDAELPFSARTAQRLMNIAADERLTKPDIVSLLPASWAVLYELTNLTDNQLRLAREWGFIGPDMVREHLKLFRELAHLEPLAEGCPHFVKGMVLMTKMASPYGTSALYDPMCEAFRSSAAAEEPSAMLADPLAALEAYPKREQFVEMFEMMEDRHHEQAHRIIAKLKAEAVAVDGDEGGQVR